MAPAPSTASTCASSEEWHEAKLAPSSAQGLDEGGERHVAMRDELVESPSPSSSSAASPYVGGDFESDYELLGAVLGTGASGSVRQARCRHTGRHAAVKSFRVKELPAKTLVNLERELDVHSAMKHPGIVNIQAVYDTEEVVHIVMDELCGGELFDRLLERGRFREEEAARVAIQLLQSVSYLHSQNVMHRDIKPENVMYCSKGGDEVKLIDFGFATRFERHTKVWQRCGTMQYVAPEVLSGQGYDEKADMWSLGCLCYTLLTMKALYSGDDADVQRKNRLGSIDWSRTFHSLSPEAQDFVLCLLHVDPAGRPSAERALRHPWLKQYACEWAAMDCRRSVVQPELWRRPRQPQQQQQQRTAAPIAAQQGPSSCWASQPCLAGVAKLIFPGKQGSSGARSLGLSAAQCVVAIALDTLAWTTK